MLLALDIGNSNIVVGISANEKWVHQWRLQTDVDKTADEYAVLFKSLFDDAGLGYADLDQIIISSVVPRLTQTIEQVFEDRVHVSPVILNGKMETGITIKSSNQKTIGADLIADAVGAYEIFEDNCIVVDFGTATTVMAVQKPGELIGGAICAGLKVTIDALVSKAAQLSQIPLELPPSVIGKNTVESMQSGLVLGHVSMVEGLVARMQKKMGSAKVIATGGLSEEIGHYTEIFDEIDPMLTLDGLRHIMNRQG
jgi:type III pantothenate kinase